MRKFAEIQAFPHRFSWNPQIAPPHERGRGRIYTVAIYTPGGMLHARVCERLYA